jgi:poly-gamma-glutamate capsule biosynthesis protein CapA/YwtB (metallophosphatase superfamily)
MTTDFALRAEAWKLMLDKARGCGRVMIEAEYETSAGWLPVRGIELRVVTGEGFHAGLSECFGMPYVFGIAVQEEAGRQGVDTGWGGDCSNFLAQAWRRSGVRVEWGDPGRLRSQLATVAEQVTPDTGVKVDAEMIRRGVAVDFGRHVAALWQDREPLGVLDAGDLMAHHLGGRPAVVRLDELTRARGEFAIRVPQRGPACRLSLAGDVVLTGDTGKGLADLTNLCREADLGLANLEGIPSGGQPDQAPKFDFRFPAERLLELRRAGIRVVNLANNHAADAGMAGMLEGRAAVENAGIGAVGAGGNLAEAVRPWRGEVKGVRLAVFGVSVVEAPAAGAGRPGVLRLPDHAGVFGPALLAARGNGAVVVVLVHWGDEHVTEPNDEQREWTHWLVGNGASVVAGSGPHVVQKTEMHGGAAIAYSLGNAVYPSALRGRGSGFIWSLAIDAHGAVVSAGRQAVP